MPGRPDPREEAAAAYADAEAARRRSMVLIARTETLLGRSRAALSRMAARDPAHRRAGRTR